MERHHIDLVSFQNNSVERDGKHYSYVLSIIDCFSRYFWLRAPTNKQSKTGAQQLEEVYLEFGSQK